MAAARSLTYETRVKGIDMIHLDELENQNEYGQLFPDDDTLFFLPYESGITYDLQDAVLEQAFIGNVKAFEGYQSESAAEIDTKPSPLVIASHCGHLALVQYLCQKGASVDEVSLRGITPLFAAAAEGQIHVMTWLLQNKADANAQEESGYHPLIVSALQGRGDMVKLLLHFGAKVNLGDNFGRTALMAACQKGSIMVVEILLKRGALVSLQSKNGSTAAVYAALSNQFQVLKMLHLFDPNVFESYGSHNMTLLAHICLHGNLELVKALHNLNHSLLHQVDKKGRTALMAATEGGNVELVKYLVKSGSSVNSKTVNDLQALNIAILGECSEIIDILLPDIENVDIQDRYGNTFLLLASEIGDLRTVKCLVESYADVNHQNHLGFTPLMVASKRGDMDIINYLLEKNVDIKRTTMNDLTAVDIAYLYNQIDVVKALESISRETISPHLQLFVAARGDVVVMKQLWQDHLISANIVEKYGVTCLMVASYRGNNDIVHFLLQNDIQAKVYNRHGFGALEYALVSNRTTTADLLVGYGHGFHPNSDGKFIIHACVLSGCHDLVSFILYNGPNTIHSRTIDGMTPLMLASQNGVLETVKLLVSNGAALSIKSKEGFTAHEYAFMIDNHDIARFLQEEKDKQEANKEPENPIQTPFERMVLDFQIGHQLDSGMPPILPSFNVTPFLQACMEDNMETAEKLYRKGCNVHIKDMEGANALIMACDNGSTRLTKWLIAECGLTPNSAKNGNFTALMAASRGGHLGCTNVLLDHHALINETTEQTCKTALHVAAANNNTEIVELLLSQGALVDVEDIEGITPLSLACLRGNLESMEIFLNSQANIHHTDGKGRTPLMNAARNGHMPIVEVLVQTYNVQLEMTTNHGKTAIIYARNNGHHEIAAWIENQICARQNPKFVVSTLKEITDRQAMSSRCNESSSVKKLWPDPSHDLNFCHVPGQQDCPLCFEGLIDNVAHELTGWTYNNILYTCVRNGNITRLIILLDQGFNVNYQNEDGLTLLMVAASLGELEMVAILLERDSDINLINHQGQDAMALALDAPHFDVAELLADKLHTTYDNLILLQGWSSEDENINRSSVPSAKCNPADNVCVTAAVHQEINKKWQNMIGDCYKVITIVIQRDRPGDIYHVYHNSGNSEVYIHTRPDQLDQVKAYINDKILHLLPCSKFLCMKYVLMPDCNMLSMKNPVEHFYRQLSLENGGMNAAAHSDLVNKDQGEGSRSEVHMHSDKELMNLNVVIQGCSSPARIVMTSIVSQHRSASPSASAAKPVFYTDTFAVIMGDNFTGSLSRLNGNLVHLADSNQAIGFVLGQVHNICLPEEENMENAALVCFKIN